MFLLRNVFFVSWRVYNTIAFFSECAISTTCLSRWVNSPVPSIADFSSDSRILILCSEHHRTRRRACNTVKSTYRFKNRTLFQYPSKTPFFH